MIKIFYLGFLLIILLSCDRLNKENSNPKLIEENKSVLTIDSIKNKKIIFSEKDIDFLNVARSFYGWYINLYNKRDSLVSLTISKGENNNCTLKNFDNYLNSMKSIGTLTDKFIDFERQRLLNCKQHLESLNWCFCDTSSYYEITDDTPCEHTFKFWLHNTQEIVDDFKIVEYKINDSSAYAIIAFYTTIEDKKYRQYFEAEEFLIKKNDKWFIDNIKMRWHK